MCTANSPRIHNSWMQWAPATPSDDAIAVSRLAASVLVVARRNGLLAGASERSPVRVVVNCDAHAR